MKIQGPNHFRVNPYQKQLQKQEEMQKKPDQKDHIEISKAAKQLHTDEETTSERLAHVEKIKQTFEAGDYQVNSTRTANKMLGFWNIRS